MSLAIGTFDSYVKALTKNMLWTAFCTHTSLLLKQENWDPEKDLCWVVLRKVHVYMFVYQCLSYYREFGALFVLLCGSSNQANDKSALTKAAPPAVPPDCVSYNTKGACCPSLVACWKRDLVASSFLKLLVFEGSKHAFVSRRSPHRVPTSGVTDVTEACYKDLPLGIKIFATRQLFAGGKVSSSLQVFKAHVLCFEGKPWNTLKNILKIIKEI